MSDLRKAAEMALEALEWNYDTDLCDIENCTAWLDKMNATIPALRQALAQTEQEPVKYTGNGTAGREADVRPTGFLFQMPKREWVELTISEVIQLIPSTEWRADLTLLFAKEIEEILRKKNGG